MSAIIDVSSVGYVGFSQASNMPQKVSGQANFADYLDEAEKSAVSGQNSAISVAVQPAITGLISSNSTPSVVKAQEPDVDEKQSSSKQSARDKFLEYMEMTPEERFFIAMLEKKGYTKEEYEALPLEEKIKIQKEIEEEARNRTEQKVETGSVGETTVQEKSKENALPAGPTSVASISTEKDDDKALDWL